MEGEIKMKKKLCSVMATIMIAGTTPSYAAEWTKYEKKETEHLFTAKVGTTEFRKNGEVQPLDVPIYVKDGYTMLPLRTFMKAVDADATMTWDNMAKRAQVELGGIQFSFDVTGNRIWGGMELLKTSGKMEVVDGRVFVPLRNWGEILNHYGYVVKDGDIQWDAKSKTATILAMDMELVDGAESFVLTGKGTEAEYWLNWPGRYSTAKTHSSSAGSGAFSS